MTIARRTIFNVLIVAVLFALPVVVHSFTLIDLANETDIPITNQNTGQCSSVNIGNIISKFNSDYAKQQLAEAKQVLTDTFKNYWQQWVMCIAGSTIFSGSGVSGAKSCTSQVADATKRTLENQFERRFAADLITDCTAQSDVRATINDARRILQENGRDGGAVYVRNWRTFQADNRYRGLQIARNEMANTNHCPWVGNQLQGLFSYDPLNAAPPMSGNEDGLNNYRDSAACTLPDDFNPGADRYQTTEAFAAMMMPQNNIWGSYLLAQEEINRQISDEEQAAQNEFANTGGVGSLRAINPATGNSCAVMAADGSTCLQYSNIEQPSAGVVAEIQAQRQALYDLVTNPRTTSQVAADVQSNLVSSFMSMNQPLAQLQYRRGGVSGTVTPEPIPTPTNVPGSGDEGDPICTGGNPDCHCAINMSTEQELARGAVLNATRAAINQHPEMVTPDGVSVLPGQNVPFLQAVCEQGELSAVGVCRPDNSGFGLVIAVEPIEIGINVILPNNVIRKPGVVTLVCTSPGNL